MSDAGTPLPPDILDRPPMKLLYELAQTAAAMADQHAGSRVSAGYRQGLIKEVTLLIGAVNNLYPDAAATAAVNEAAGGRDDADEASHWRVVDTWLAALEETVPALSGLNGYAEITVDAVPGLPALPYRFLLGLARLVVQLRLAFAPEQRAALIGQLEEQVLLVKDLAPQLHIFLCHQDNRELAMQFLNAVRELDRSYVRSQGRMLEALFTALAWHTPGSAAKIRVLGGQVHSFSFT